MGALEFTSKQLKLEGLISTIIFIVSFIMWVLPTSEGIDLIGGTVAVLSIAWNISVRVRIWWNHD